MAELNDGLSFEVRREGATTILVLSGELDLPGCDRLAESAADIVAAVRERLVIDASALRFADSSAIALWVQWRASVPEFEIRDPPPIVRRVIEMMGLTDRLGVR